MFIVNIMQFNTHSMEIEKRKGNLKSKLTNTHTNIYERFFKIF